MADVFIRQHRRERAVQLGSLLFVPVNIGLLCYLGVSNNAAFATCIFVSITLQTMFNLWFVSYAVFGALFLTAIAPLIAIFILILVLLLVYDMFNYFANFFDCNYSISPKFISWVGSFGKKIKNLHKFLKAIHYIKFWIFREEDFL